MKNAGLFWRGSMGVVVGLIAAFGHGCEPPRPSCLPPSVMYMGRCLPPCVENGVDYCAGPDGSVIAPTDASHDVVDRDTDTGVIRDVTDATPDRLAPCGAAQPTRCGDQCVDTMSSQTNCGACGVVCSISGGMVCVMGVCRSTGCMTGFGDCDMNAANGCETATSSNLAHCGACGMQCPMVANGTATCTAGARGVDCAMGFTRIGGACIADGAAPRPITPLSLGDVTLRRPTLRWELPMGFDGAEVQLCRDRACTMVIETIAASGNSARPAMDLPARSVVFWRLRGRVGMNTAMATSPTWLFHVPARDATAGIDSSANPHNDVNGDGFDDLAVTSPFASPMGRNSAGLVRIFHGFADGIPVAPALTINGENASDQLGTLVSQAGDLNGDGFGDLLVSAPNASPGGRMNAGYALVFLGSPMGINPVPARTILGASAEDYLGERISTGGDINRDGFADILIGVPGADPRGVTNAGAAQVYFGTPTGVGNAPTTLLEGLSAESAFGENVASIGDANGDGFSDIVVGSFLASPGGRVHAGTASVFYGSAIGVANVPDRVLAGESADALFGFSVASAGDVNGDGFSDLVVGAYGTTVMGQTGVGQVQVYHGARTGIGAVSNAVFSGIARFDNFGLVARGLGDVNGDGFGDLAIAAPFANPMGIEDAGTVDIFRGSAMGVSPVQERTLVGPAALGWFGVSLTGPADFNADGHMDLAVGAPRTNPGGLNAAGSTVVYLGNMGGVGPGPQVTIRGGAAMEQSGSSVATLDRTHQQRTPHWLQHTNPPPSASRRECACKRCSLRSSCSV